MINDIQIRPKNIEFEIHSLSRLQGYEGTIMNGIPMSTNVITSSGYGTCNIKIIMSESFYNKINMEINQDLQLFADNCGGNKSIYYCSNGYLDIYISGYRQERNFDVRQFIISIGQKIKRLEYEESIRKE